MSHRPNDFQAPEVFQAYPQAHSQQRINVTTGSNALFSQHMHSGQNFQHAYNSSGRSSSISNGRGGSARSLASAQGHGLGHSSHQQSVNAQQRGSSHASSTQYQQHLPFHQMGQGVPEPILVVNNSFHPPNTRQLYPQPPQTFAQRQAEQSHRLQNRSARNPASAGVSAHVPRPHNVRNPQDAGTHLQNSFQGNVGRHSAQPQTHILHNSRHGPKEKPPAQIHHRTYGGPRTIHSGLGRCATVVDVVHVEHLVSWQRAACTFSTACSWVVQLMLPVLLLVQRRVAVSQSAHTPRQRRLPRPGPGHWPRRYGQGSQVSTCPSRRTPVCARALLRVCDERVGACRLGPVVGDDARARLLTALHHAGEVPTGALHQEAAHPTVGDSLLPWKLPPVLERNR